MKNRYFSRLAVLLLLLNKTYLQAQTLPTNIASANLRLWLDASDVNNGTANQADGTLITTWYDKSGGARNATTYPGQASGRVYSNQINGKSVVRFARVSGTSGSVYQIAGVDIRAVSSSAVTIFTVYKQGTQSGDQGLWGDDNGNWDRFFFTSWSSNPSAGANNGGASLGPTNPAAIVTGAGTVGVTRLMTAVYNYGVTNGSNIYFNGQTITTFTDQTSTTDAQTSFRIGWDGDDNCFNGDIAEVIVYNTKLTDCQIQQVNRYLGAKYGVTFSTVSINTAGGATSFPEGSSLALSSSVTGTAYQWLLNGNPISGATGSSYTATIPGDYKVAVTNSCTDTSAAVTLTATTMTTPGNALNFDGVNDYVDGGSGASLAATNIKTMECWARFGSFTGDQEIISRSIGSSGIELLLYANALSFYCMNATTGAGSYISYPVSNLATGVWYHLAAAWDGSTKESMRLYVNGLPVGNRTDYGNINGVGVTNPTGSFRIGQWSQSGTNRFFNGSIDEVRVWSTQRSQSEIQSNMYNIINPTTGLTAYYKFDLGTASGTNSSVTSVYDVSGNGVTGTLSGFALTGTSSNWMESYAMVVPTLWAPTSVGSNRFTANWTAPTVGTVNNYALDVSTSPAFSSFVSGYNGLNVGTGTSYAVTGLSPATTYYYRVRANKTSVASQGSYPASSITATTLATLPVTLTDFTAKQQGTAVLLQWNTASEFNSAHFSVERSSNGVDFTRIATVQAAGSSSALRHYAANDNTPGKGLNYYRLLQVDKDGNYTYSTVQQVLFAGDKAYTILYPSPAADFFNIESNDAALAGKTGIVSDMQGRVVKKFTVSGSKQQVDISALTKGIYHVQLGDKAVFRLVKE
ncbi:MAG: T9SS type A sorting domain-containing protein [Williamsia sp.]|nr:T9SS type A sorting domain-containing protein [Williamsia sp.]